MPSQEYTTQIGGRSEIKRLVEAAGGLGDPDGYAGKRGSTRFAKSLQLEVTTDPENFPASRVAAMHNISTDGVAFWSKKDASRGSTLYVREFCSEEVPHPWLQAQVTHCTVGIRGYLIGVAFV